MNTRTGCDTGSYYRSDSVTQTTGDRSSMTSSGGSTLDAMGSMTANAWDLMVRMPLQATAAGLQWMTSGMQRIGQNQTDVSGSGSGFQSTSSSSSSSQNSGQSSLGSWVNPANWGTGSSATNQDLSGNDLKYVVWSIVFTKPGYEAVLEPMQSELVNYSTDVSSFAALKIAKCVERGRFGKLDKPSTWNDRGYPAESQAAASRRTETTASTSGASTSVTSKTETSGSPSDKGWRIPGDDQHYLQFLYRVEWRLPKEEPEVTRVERVTIERAS